MSARGARRRKGTAAPAAEPPAPPAAQVELFDPKAPSPPTPPTPPSTPPSAAPAPPPVAPAPTASRATVRRSVVFVHGGEAADAPPRRAALAEALSAAGCASRTATGRELAAVRDAIVVFEGETGAGPLLRSRLAGNLNLIDVRCGAAGPRLPWAARLVDGAIFRTLRQQKDLDRPRWTSRVIYDEAEPGLVPHAVPQGEFRAACFGAGAAGEQFGRLDGVAFIDSQPLRHARQFNCHLVLRVPGPAELYQPGAEVANAAACGALLVTMRDAAAVELLGADYPFFCTAERSTIEATLRRARESCGGAQWSAALARLHEAAARTTLATAVEQHLEHFAAVEAGRRSAVESKAPAAGPAASG